VWGRGRGVRQVETEGEGRGGRAGRTARIWTWRHTMTQTSTSTCCRSFWRVPASDDLRGLHAFKGRKSKRKKSSAVDRRASKGRKIRYTVMTPLVNFMAPEPMQESPMTGEPAAQTLWAGVRVSQSCPC